MNPGEILAQNGYLVGNFRDGTAKGECLVVRRKFAFQKCLGLYMSVHTKIQQGVFKDVRAQKFPRTDFFKNFDCR